MSPAMQEFAEVVAWLKSDLANHTSRSAISLTRGWQVLTL